MAGARQLELARLRVMRTASGADFALGYGAEEEERIYDARWITLADVAVAQSPGQMIVARLSGEELLDIHRRWLVDGQMLAHPSVLPGQVAPERLYRVAVRYDLCRWLAERERALQDVEAGPAWPQEAFWQEVFPFHL
jgi:hypothetical protein